MRRFLLRLGDGGEPVESCSNGKGVLVLPSVPFPKNKRDVDPLFTVRLVIAAGCPISRDGLVWTNCPLDSGSEFIRSKFHKHLIRTSFHQDAYVDLNVFVPGSYCYYVSFKGDKDKLDTTRKFYFIVPPALYIGDRYLPMGSLSVQTLVSKWIDKNDWSAMFSKVAEKGYNMIHFTPLQKRGKSDSPYSLFDQLQFDPTFFQDKNDVIQMVNKLHKEYGILTMTDVVFNHTASDSLWLLDHPEAAYNMETAPQLISAMELDHELIKFSDNMEELGYPIIIKSTSDLLHVIDGIKTHVLNHLKLWEFYVINVQKTLAEVPAKWNATDDVDIEVPEDIKYDLTKLAEYVRTCAAEKNFTSLSTRYSNQLNILKFISILKGLYGTTWGGETQQEAVKILDAVNLPLYKDYDTDVAAILEQLYNRIRYLRLDPTGPQLGKITKECPLTECYFTRVTAKNGKEYSFANNGWIWNGNPLVDFASSDSRAYLRREVIIWSDCVKLRYGNGPEDSPYLWERMSKYITLNAEIFDGFRIDNCHSTPLHVGEYFLDLARKVNPNLYITAELFTGNEALDCLFVERLAISSLIREAMQASSEEELSSIVHRYGGKPIGSYHYMPLDDFPYSAQLPKDDISLPEFGFIQQNANPEGISYAVPNVLTATSPHALFMDCTHDNETPYQRRTLEDTLPTALLVSFCSSAIGSVYGYDEVYPHQLDLVQENRTYSVQHGDGISNVRSKLNKIRSLMVANSDSIEDSEMYLHHDWQYITCHKTHAKSPDGWFLIARTKFFDDGKEQTLPDITLSSIKCKLEFSYSLEKIGDVPAEDDSVIHGIPTRLNKLDGFVVKYDSEQNVSTISLPEYFPKGSIAVFRTTQLGFDKDLDQFIKSGIVSATENLNLYSLNTILYRCNAEELDITSGRIGVYYVPNYGELCYCGLQGWVSVLKDVIFRNDLAHPLSEHLRNGHWAMDYMVDRLNEYAENAGISEIKEWLRLRFERVKLLPYYLIPRYFALVVGVAYAACRCRAMSLMPKHISCATLFVQRLAMMSIQLVSKVQSASLYPDINVPSMAAGLPHFSTGHMRCWGRDVFISLRGLLVITGRVNDAKAHILGFAKTLKHGLIPNLLAAGREPRYNARDATWFFLQSVQDYITIVPDGEQILNEKVTRRFPLDDRYIPYDDPECFTHVSSVEDIIYEIFARHARGIKYREANAGPDLDRVMKDNGFNVEVTIDWDTGLIHGGSQDNCGTWMDKMGESKKAGTYGVPGTPRNGAAIEINGLLKSALRFVIDLNERGLFKYKEVVRSDNSKITFKEWNRLLQNNFERFFYIPKDPSRDSDYEINPILVNRRGIYKDLFGTGKPYEDYQLRPNFAIAMTVAPELFTPEFAMGALEIADNFIRGPIGMVTLDPSDSDYYPYYVNSEDSYNAHTAKGRNYHQGPEWVWCTGFFLRAYHHFNVQATSKALVSKRKISSSLYHQLSRRLDGHRNWIAESPWAGLTELTNKDGQFCHDSSPTQSWSSGCLLDLFYDLWSEYENF
ncbi:bifunctional 4-alpha-glucanotransferase/amylo-alpha-1,6-glucosidase Ecym_2815 [Eremothecium cymbalariae DBVPG|uniref:Glycogen debranching enzyme n=1 Tax=Eremothecium cymbalariae (strain CBS 270.75 / DBVPG 7215 / KCTC 17166 / NRRL Y-17582) TaxID=931890 RepID=G8JQE8_ERECY|nr:Hypothetical protein Ecym_2815 [Eremothecium cymbalariae DBVPG\